MATETGPRLTEKEIQTAVDLIADPIYRPKHVWDAITDAQLRKAWTCAVKELNEYQSGNAIGDEWFRLAAELLAHKATELGFEPWEEHDD